MSKTLIVNSSINIYFATTFENIKIKNIVDLTTLLCVNRDNVKNKNFEIVVIEKLKRFDKIIIVNFSKKTILVFFCFFEMMFLIFSRRLLRIHKKKNCII